MALTITQTKRNNVIGTKIQSFVNVTFDNSYPTGGEEFDANAFVGDVDTVDINVKEAPNTDIGGVLLRYDYTTKTIKAFASSTQASGDPVSKGDATTAGGLALIELADTNADLDGLVAEIVITGGR